MHGWPECLCEVVKLGAARDKCGGILPHVCAKVVPLCMWILLSGDRHVIWGLAVWV